MATDSPCQDYSIARKVGNAHILVMSDGAGSCKQSRLGARNACLGFMHSAVKLLNQYLSEATALDEYLLKTTEKEWQMVIEGARARIMRTATQRHLDIHDDMACTLLGAVVGRSVAIVIQVGDGAWVAESGSSIFSCVTWPEHGEFENETFFVTHPDWRKHLQFEAIPKSHGMRSLYGFSDGVERLCLDFRRKIPVDGFFRPLNKLRVSTTRGIFEGAIWTLLGSERVSQLTNDDCSVVSICHESLQ